MFRPPPPGALARLSPPRRGTCSRGTYGHRDRWRGLFVGVSRASYIIICHTIYVWVRGAVPAVIYHFAYNCPIQVRGKLNYAHAMYQRHGANICGPRDPHVCCTCIVVCVSVSVGAPCDAHAHVMILLLLFAYRYNNILHRNNNDIYILYLVRELSCLQVTRCTHTHIIDPQGLPEKSDAPRLCVLCFSRRQCLNDLSRSTCTANTHGIVSYFNYNFFFACKNPYQIHRLHSVPPTDTCTAQDTPKTTAYII